MTTKNYIYIILTIFLGTCSNKEIVMRKYPNGQSKVVYKIISGTKDNPIDFLFKAFYDNGKLMKEGLIKNKLEDGEWKYYFENGKTSSVGNFKNGIRTGKFNRYYDNGQMEQEGLYQDGNIKDVKYFFRNGKPKWADYKLPSLIKPTCAPWTDIQIKKMKSRCNQVLQFDFQNTVKFCDCIIDSVSKHVDFNTMDTLSDMDRGSIYQTIMQNGSCNGLLLK